jgi:hypothetical protein
MQNEQQCRSRRGVGRCDPNTITAELLQLSGLSLPELRAAWSSHLGSSAPLIRSRKLLLRMLAWQIQEKILGGLDTHTQRTLRSIAAALEHDGNYEPKIRHDLSPGVILTREWKGIVQKVTVTAEGFQYLGKRYKSLSVIARTITGSRWSGPRFFGLQQKSAPASRRAPP